MTIFSNRRGMAQRGKVAVVALAAAFSFGMQAAAQSGEAAPFESTFDQTFAPVAPVAVPIVRPAARSIPSTRMVPVPDSWAAPSAPAARRVVVPVLPTTAVGNFSARIAALANASQGRIGVAAVDLTSGRAVTVMGDQPFPLASTSKIAIAATFLDGVDHGIYSLNTQYPLMVPLPSRKFDGPIAPVRAGSMMSALGLIDLSLTRSDNQAADALLAAVGGPRAVNAWLRKTGNSGIRMDRDIATLVRDDGAVNPAVTIDRRDSTTPVAMVQLLSGLYRGQWLSPTSQNVLLGTMTRCLTGRHRLKADLPEGIQIAHKTGTLSNTASDVGVITTPSGRSIAVAIYVTGQGTKIARDARIATISRAIYDGYASEALASR